MIVSFADKVTADLFHGRESTHARRVPASLTSAVRRKLDVLNAAERLSDLWSPPGNRLEALRGNWKGFYSLRVNDQWRVVFRWKESRAHDVRLIDYHRS